jgi:hypothetical protein
MMVRNEVLLCSSKPTNMLNKIMKTIIVSFFSLLFALAVNGAPPMMTIANSPDRVEVKTFAKPGGIVLHGSEKYITPDAFRPPVDISIVAKTDSTNLRMAYAANQVIFNWEVDRSELRVDGGPADGDHKNGMGVIPVDKYVTIRWEVTPMHQAIYVDGELRFEHCRDYSGIYNPVSVFPAAGSTVTIKSITVTQLGIYSPVQTATRAGEVNSLLD